MEHLIKEIFLVVPNLGLRVADGQYDLCGPQDEILSPSNWESMIKPGWEITMRMWPNPERPPWEYAGPRAMLQDRHNIGSRGQDEASHGSLSQQEEDDLYDSENPRLREPRAHHRRKPTTEVVGDIIVEERRPRTNSRPPRKYLSYRGYGSDSDEWDEEYTRPKDHKFLYEHSETPQSRELGPHQTGEQISKRYSAESLWARSRSPASVRTPTSVHVEAPRNRKRRPAPGPFIHYSSEEDEDESSFPPEANSEHDRRTRSLSPRSRYEAEKERIRQREFRERDRRERIRREELEARDRAALLARLERQRVRDEERERVTSLEDRERQLEREERRERAGLLERFERQRERDEQGERQERREARLRERLAAEQEAIRQQAFDRKQTRIRKEREDREHLSAARRTQQLLEDRARRLWEEERAHRRATYHTRSSPASRSSF